MGSEDTFIFSVLLLTKIRPPTDVVRYAIINYVLLDFSVIHTSLLVYQIFIIRNVDVNLSSSLPFKQNVSMS